ncbi:peptidase, T1 family [Oesophagostomum dentatum]|uniref:Peptidase, T1 family n=1 Tax=Oesophagostomum dentatum TaxID=61180 RepID=A0A0B1RWJ8_OESDE|nr:peptidase, T1 family [Oesophagostomum dentatum]
MWGCTFDDYDEEDKSVAVMKNQLLHEPNLSTFAFPQPPLGIQAKDFVATHFGKDAKNMQFRKGTTTLAFIYEPATAKDKGGIVVAVDSRASSGEYISSKSVMKILDIGDHMVATMAGGAADCQFWTRTVAKYCNLFELREKTQITVAAASKYFANVLYGYRGMGLSVVSFLLFFLKF